MSSNEQFLSFIKDMAKKASSKGDASIFSKYASGIDNAMTYFPDADHEFIGSIEGRTCHLGLYPNKIRIWMKQNILSSISTGKRNEEYSTVQMWSISNIKINYSQMKAEVSFYDFGKHISINLRKKEGMIFFDYIKNNGRLL